MVVKNKIKKKIGFSLIELIIGLAILGIVSTGTVQMLGTGSTILLRQVSSNVRLDTERFTLDGIYNELRKGSVASLDILTSDDPTLTIDNSFDKFIFLKADGNDRFRAFLREWDASDDVPIDRPLVGADGIRTLEFSIREAIDPIYANYMLSIDVTAARVNNANDTERTAHRDVGFFARTAKGSDNPATGGVYSGNAVRFLFFVPDTEPDAIVYFVKMFSEGGRDPDTDPTHDGLSWEKAFATVQKGINTAANTNTSPSKISNEVWVKKGTYREVSVSVANSTFELKVGVKLYGGFEGTETKPSQRDSRNPNVNATTTLEAISNTRVIEVAVGADNNDTIIDGFTITGGRRPNVSANVNSGGGMRIIVTVGTTPSRPTVENCIFIDNMAYRGGGIFVSGVNTDRYLVAPNIINCKFYGNESYASGGGLLSEFSSLTVTNCAFINNSSGQDGGGMRNISVGTMNITGCLFTANHAPGYGGGVSILDSTNSVIITNCTFSGNDSHRAPLKIHNPTDFVML